jgi:hypothetical protein
MTRFHALFFELYDLLVHIVVASSRNTDFKFHCFERLIRFKFCWSFIELLYSLHFNLFYLDLCYRSYESVSDAFIGLPYDLQVVPYFTEKFDVFPEVFELLHIARFQTEQLFSLAAASIIQPNIINSCV